VATDAIERQPATLDLDPGRDRRPYALRSLGLGEAADMIDRLLEGRPVLVGEPIAGCNELRALEDQPSIAQPATESLVRLADGGGTPRANVVEDRPGFGPDPLIRGGSATDQGSTLSDRGGLVGPEIQATQDGSGRSVDGHATIFSIGRTRIPDAPAALRRGSRLQTSSAPT